MTQRITAIPDEPRRGGTMKVCYDFVGLSVESVVLNIDFDPPDGSVSVSLTPTSPCANVSVPDTAMAWQSTTIPTCRPNYC